MNAKHLEAALLDRHFLETSSLKQICYSSFSHLMQLIMHTTLNARERLALVISDYGLHT